MSSKTLAHLTQGGTDGIQARLT